MKLVKNQAGVMNPIVIVVLVLVVGAAAFAGWRVYDSNNKDDKSSSSNTSSITPTKAEMAEAKAECLKVFDDKDFCTFASNWEQAKLVKSVFSTKGPDGKTTVMTIETNGDDSSSVVTEDGKEVSAIISLKGVGYMKNADDNVWYKYPAATSGEGAGSSVPPNPQSEIDFEEEIAKNTTKVKKIGKEKVGNVDALKYQITDSADPDTVETFIWFNPDNYQMVKLTTKTKDGSLSEATFEYPSSITIKEPSPVKDFPGLDSVPADL